MAAAQAELDQALKDRGHLANLRKKTWLVRPRWSAAAIRSAAPKLASLGSYARKSAYAELRADRSGVITAVDAEPGQIIAAGQAIVRLAQTDEKEVVISVPENRSTPLLSRSTCGPIPNISTWGGSGKFRRAWTKCCAPITPRFRCRMPTRV
ncbi:MAG: HlyD family efflux transporter periplasmic adaptor subunit [Verrucomicrobia bacterium]|nr:MAG: HlyD family efflux transporter periplasmic adaptor subunit [Verrucomicrobiota bacterium]